LAAPCARSTIPVPAISIPGPAFAAPIISGRGSLLAQAFPNLTGQQIIDILFRSATSLAHVARCDLRARPAQHPARLPADRNHDRCDGKTAYCGALAGSLPAASGDGGGKTGAKFGTIILDGYSRAFALDLTRSLEAAEQRRPLEQALTGRSRTNGVTAGPVAVSLTMAQREQRAFVDMTQLAIGPDDARQSRLVAGNAIVRLDRKTRLAFGISEAAKSLERDLSGAAGGAFLVARDTSAEPGFAARRGSSVAVRRELGRTLGLTLSAENGEVYRQRRPMSLICLTARHRHVRQAPRQHVCRSA
jgi:hypothetical protein